MKKSVKETILVDSYQEKLTKIGKISEKNENILGIYIFKIKKGEDLVYFAIYQSKNDIEIICKNRKRKRVLTKMLETLLVLGDIQYEDYLKHFPREKRENVDSSNIKSIGYTNKIELLEIEFNNNRVYEYYEVPEKIYIEFINSESIGSAFHKLIRNVFSYKQQ